MEERKSPGAKVARIKFRMQSGNFGFFFSHWGQQQKGWLFPEPI